MIRASCRHHLEAGRGFRLTLYVIGGTLRIEVTDTRGDQPVPGPQHRRPTAESGRGLVIVEALADRWGVIPGPPPRKTVWAEIGPAATDPRNFPSR
ncbi:ATP-binding protein [Streptomyces sp. IB201691-2A2]|uniref:ATP-binding protein n=1 Tax=unclassified Streptomyces TaxID=2593676 RepID=UPI0037DA1DA9